MTNRSSSTNIENSVSSSMKTRRCIYTTKRPIWS